ncbi:Ubiquitin-conjugating enzyme E2 variant 1C [Diplonema papillatum]|nr:Ubiquitin-conjugating enzyme E2 variant 1C [Diplonema papillatum]
MAKVVVPRNFKLIDELEKAEKDPTTAGISLGLVDYNDIYMHNWNATIFGPMGTAFENRIYSLKIACDQHYPNKAPHICFLTKVNMDAVNGKGEVEASKVAVMSNWKPELGMMDCLMGLRQLMVGKERKTRQPPPDTMY